ncbi:hypothetical protein Tco_0784048, partial [Tanacetum coccineum]
DDDNLMRWKEQLLRAVNINDAAGILILILATPALFIHLAPHAPIIQTRTMVSVLTPNIPALYEMHFAVPMAGVVLSQCDLRVGVVGIESWVRSKIEKLVLSFETHVGQ